MVSKFFELVSKLLKSGLVSINQIAIQPTHNISLVMRMLTLGLTPSCHQRATAKDLSNGQSYLSICYHLAKLVIGPQSKRIGPIECRASHIYFNWREKVSLCVANHKQNLVNGILSQQPYSNFRITHNSHSSAYDEVINIKQIRR